MEDRQNKPLLLFIRHKPRKV